MIRVGASLSGPGNDSDAIRVRPTKSKQIQVELEPRPGPTDCAAVPITTQAVSGMDNFKSTSTGIQVQVTDILGYRVSDCQWDSEGVRVEGFLLSMDRFCVTARVCVCV